MRYFKKQLFNSSVILLSVFTLSCIWEFILEPSWPFYLYTNPKESLYERWEYVLTATFFCFIALVIPSLRTRKLEMERDAAFTEKQGLIKRLEELNSDLKQEILAHKYDKAEKEKLIAELHQKITEIQTLQEFIPICMICKKIRNAQGNWEQFEPYVLDHAGARFTHGICPSCSQKHYPKMVEPGGK